MRSIGYLLSTAALAMVLISGLDQMTKSALKVQHLLKQIETRHSRSNNKKRAANVTQTELNAYIKYRLSKEKDPYIKGLNVVLSENNQIRGKLQSDARPLNLSFLFGDLLDFDFKGILYTHDGKARLNLSAIEINGQPIKPEMLDLILSAAAQYNGAEPASIGDWYELPKGIDRVTVNKGKATLYY